MARHIVVADRALAADSPAAAASVAAARVASLEEPVAETTALGHLEDEMAAAALDHMVVGFAHLGHPEDKMIAAALGCIVVDIAAPEMVGDTSAAGGTAVVGTVVTFCFCLSTLHQFQFTAAIIAIAR